MMSYWCLPATMRSIWVSQSECAGTTSLVPMNLNKVNIFHRVHMVTRFRGTTSKTSTGSPSNFAISGRWNIVCLCYNEEHNAKVFPPVDSRWHEDLDKGIKVFPSKEIIPLLGSWTVFSDLSSLDRVFPQSLLSQYCILPGFFTHVKPGMKSLKLSRHLL